ncbi:efflux RND transporter periplasmic adaptor subunit [sulfur-oxidizing endosymbiont of Gigantopelta aegis]|uniref:efflux RND transporter periplasmic adaptor subunit n=1 Tax=sulfur-oxidizing endosymbiont of Gigantopelta aegis TaxID=2794934 RepID=UPI001FE61CE3|nr:efflux RND transporter periplasmic adaptor subunit [sulfur-oxidizing endosymbiont of Gigantopelta aegis]
MKSFHPFSVIAITLFIMILIPGCDKKQEVEKVAEVRLVKTIIVKTPDAGGIRHFPGRIDANRKAGLSFRVSGKVQELLVKEGDLVANGDTIAKLDPTDFQITVNDKKAVFTRASNDYNRGKKLVKEGHISKMDYDKLESSFLSAQAELNLAKQQLVYTELKAPFSGTVARRYIQSFEEIQAKQPIIILNDNEILEVKFDLPENLILRIQRIEGINSMEQSTMKHQIPVVAIFQSRADKEFPLTFKEMSTKADASTQTFSVTYTMPKPARVIILPGMTTTVKVDLSKMIERNDVFYLPVSAVVADAALQSTVWIVNEQTMQVEPVSVKVGTMRGNSIEIKEGLDAGQRVVTAGVPFLYKDLKVSLMKELEQAEDNIKHEPPVMQQTPTKNSTATTPAKG